MGIILVIDDNETIREGLTAIIQKMGHTVLTAASGEAGIQLFRQRGGDVDFVITDLKMAGATGVDVLRAVREADPDCPR